MWRNEMKLAYKSLVVATALALTGAANAATASVTVAVGGPAAGALGVELSNLQGSGTLDFSADLLGALSVAGIVTTGVSPATLAETVDAEDNVLIAATAPVANLSATIDSTAGNFTVDKVVTQGGALLTAGKKNFATTKGSLSITGITVDLTTKAIYADVTGGNGAGTTNGLHVWNYTTIDGPITFPSVTAPTSSINTLKGLVITGTAFNVFAQSLGLTAGGIAAMESIKDYGVMTANISMNVSAVPEPSTYALAGVGLLVAGFAAKRRRAA